VDQIKDDFLAKGGENNNNPADKLRKAAEKKGDVQVAKDKADSKRRKGADLDPTQIWQEALAKGVNDPGLIIAVADYLAENGKFDHMAEFLKANLRLGIVARSWVYECLAIALKESKGSSVDIERAQLSLLDLQPENPQNYLKASEAMKEAGQWDRAVTFCKQAARLSPDSPAPYAEALVYAETAKDTRAMEWAAGNLLSRDWPTENVNLHEKAREKMLSLQTALTAANRRDEAERMTRAVEGQHCRDLIVSLSWQGEADLELEVREPIGTMCSFLQRQTPGGGILIGNTLTDLSQATYTAAQAFSGEYEINVRRIWGQPLGSKANLKIIQHRGTPQETVQQETIVFDQTHTLRLSLKDGRRQAVAHVPSPNANERPRTQLVKEPNGGDIRNKLRSMADPEFASVNTGMVGGMASLGVPVEPQLRPDLRPDRIQTEAIAYQTRSASLPNSMDLAAQATVSADRKYVRVSLSPVFQTATRTDSGPLVTNPLIPGAPGTGQ
jgi:tetratricopeptide (TPR) repeat protein